MSKAIAFVHARGGSKRIPRKNIKDFFGKPAIAYPIQAALDSGVFDHVVISTDDQEIADIAVKYGAECHYMRPDELANDTATTDAAYSNDIKTMQDLGYEFDYACCIYGTSIFLEPQYLKQAYETVKENNLHSAVSMTDFDFPIQRAFMQKDNGTIYLREPEFRLTRSQDLEPAYHDAALFYFMTVEKYMNNIRLFADDDTQGVHIPHYKIVDIDTPDDWIRAEMMYEALQKTKG